MQAGFIALMAVVFGIIASLVFAYFQPKFESLFCPEEEPVVTIPQDSVTETEQPRRQRHPRRRRHPRNPQAPSEEPPLQQPQELEIAMYRTCRTSVCGGKRSKPLCRDRDGGQGATRTGSTILTRAGDRHPALSLQTAVRNF